MLSVPKARLWPKAAAREEGAARRLGARHLPRRRAPVGAPPHRCGKPSARSPSGTAFVMSHGMEHWHPNPDFFFQPGAGPVLDIGPYYVTNLIQLIGPVRRGVRPTRRRRRRSARSPPSRAHGEKITVETPTTSTPCCEFDSGAHDHHGNKLGRLAATTTRTWSSTARQARCTCPTRTSSAARCG